MWHVPLRQEREDTERWMEGKYIPWGVNGAEFSWQYDLLVANKYKYKYKWEFVERGLQIVQGR